MGNVATLVNSISFNNQDVGEEDSNKGRLIFAYKEYAKHDPNFFTTLTKYLEQDENKIADFLFEENLSWPENELGLTGGEGLFNTITEEQALVLSGQIEELLPKFAKAAV